MIDMIDMELSHGENRTKLKLSSVLKRWPVAAWPSLAAKKKEGRRRRKSVFLSVPCMRADTKDFFSPDIIKPKFRKFDQIS